MLWNELKAGKLLGYKFNRQKPLGNSIVDFYCKKLNLVIEIDGISHSSNEEKDSNRQLELEKLGLRFLRFTDQEVKQKLDDVLDKIKEYVFEWEKKQSPCSPPL